MNDITEFILEYDPIIFKNKIYDDINIENSLKMNQILLKLIFNSENNKYMRPEKL